MEEAEVLELFELHYSDLVLLSSLDVSSSSSFSREELERLESTRRTIMEVLGPRGPGLLSVTGVPNASVLRRTLLPFARKLALLNPEDRKRVLKEHNLGSDVPLKNPDRNVSSFAMKLRYVQDSPFAQTRPGEILSQLSTSDWEHLKVNAIGGNEDNEFGDLGNAFEGLGLIMMELGLSLARICDNAIGGNELVQSLLESCTSKGRLIHYHSPLDSVILQPSERSKGFSKRRANYSRDQEQGTTNEQTKLQKPRLETDGGGASSLWQQWHYDYGIFTVLTDPMFLSSSIEKAIGEDRNSISYSQELPSPSSHTFLQIFDPDKSSVFMVKAPYESFIIQVGESADVISKGKLRSTLHCVYRPKAFENLSRETFVVFLQPAWNKTFSILDYAPDRCILGDESLRSSNEETHTDGINLNNLTQEIQRIIPPLSSRLKEGMTFAEFSRETTKRYYGGGGLQSNRS